jgi:metallo-beta-lactamase family protein
VHLEFFGAAGEVTGSCHILSVRGRTLLLDCGLIQGGADPDVRNRAAFPFDPARIDAVVLSHAHIDHCGRLPLLRRRGFHGPVFATGATRDLARILLADSAFMAEREAERFRRRQAEHRGGARHGFPEPLFTRDDAAATLRQFRTLPYGRPHEVVPGVQVTFHDAGHILGSAGVWLALEEEGRQARVVFSGDVGQFDSPILRDPAGDGAADVIVMECTYGNRLHRERAETLREFGDILRTARRDGGNVLIPAFAVGRSQEILYELASHFDAWGVGDWRVFLDSPMAIEASAIYQRHPDLYDEEARAAHRRAERGMPPLPNLQLCRSPEESMAINALRGGAIIVAGSGMCTGGRIVHHLKHNLPRPECDVIFTGFQAAGTLGRALVDGRTSVRIHGDVYPVRARVHTLGGFSAHGDRDDLLRWHATVRGNPRTYLVHGEAEGAHGLRDALRAHGCFAEIARPGLRVELGTAGAHRGAR